MGIHYMGYVYAHETGNDRNMLCSREYDVNINLRQENEFGTGTHTGQDLGH